MSTSLRFWTVMALLILTLPVNAAELDWELRRDRSGIQVYTAVVEGSKHKAVRATMTIDKPANELVGLVMDPDACPEWAALCKESFVANTVSPTELFVYTYNDLPWPVTDRDAVGHVRWYRDPSSQSINMHVDIVEGHVKKKRRTIRLQYGQTSWTFTPLDGGSTRVDSYAHLDPAGATPAWLTNMLLVDSPYDTMVGMREVVNTGRYADTDISFIK